MVYTFKAGGGLYLPEVQANEASQHRSKTYITPSRLQGPHPEARTLPLVSDFRSYTTPMQPDADPGVVSETSTNTSRGL